jgi:hypothetical protein
MSRCGVVEALSRRYTGSGTYSKCSRAEIINKIHSVVYIVHPNLPRALCQQLCICAKPANVPVQNRLLMCIYKIKELLGHESFEFNCLFFWVSLFSGAAKGSPDYCEVFLQHQRPCSGICKHRAENINTIRSRMYVTLIGRKLRASKWVLCTTCISTCAYFVFLPVKTH